MVIVQSVGTDTLASKVDYVIRKNVVFRTVGMSVLITKAVILNRVVFEHILLTEEVGFLIIALVVVNSDQPEVVCKANS